MKVIFLDIDGVLNSEHWYVKNHEKHPERCRSDRCIDPRFVRNLSKIVKKTGAKIVLTATIRGVVKKRADHYLHEIFKRYGLSIYDYTSKCNSVMRGYEIQDWLDRHRDVTNIVIIDDEDDMVHLSKYLVQTLSWPYIKIDDESVVRNKSMFAWITEGLNYKAVRKAIKILKKPYVNQYAVKDVMYRKTF